LPLVFGEEKHPVRRLAGRDYLNCALHATAFSGTTIWPTRPIDTNADFAFLRGPNGLASGERGRSSRSHTTTARASTLIDQKTTMGEGLGNKLLRRAKVYFPPGKAKGPNKKKKKRGENG